MADVDAGQRALQDAWAVVSLGPSEAVVLSGDDTARWCHGMFTNEVKKLAPGQGNRHAACNDRGQVLGLLDLRRLDPTQVLLVLEGWTVGAFLDRYEKFLFLDDIEATDLRASHTTLSVQGPATRAALAAAGLPAPAPGEVLPLTGGWASGRVRAFAEGVDFIVSHDDAAALHDRLRDAGAAAAAPSSLDAARVAAGRPTWPTDANEKSLVHELGIAAALCSFSKGCYVGQEVLNRVDIKGTIQKRATPLRFSGPVAAGAALLLGEDNVGHVTSVAPAVDGPRGLGLVRRAAWEPGTQLQVEGGGTAEVLGDAIG